MDLLGKPHAAQALLYVAGAVTAFLMVEIAAYGQLRVRLSSGPMPRMAVWGNVHVLSSGGAVLGVWAMDHALKGRLVGWPVAGFTATGLYVLLNAVQATLAIRAGGEDESEVAQP
jgi:hypothetical protein